MTDSNELPYDALLVVSFGGPEKREDVIPFLENVLRGKPVPRERLLEVAEHYYHFGGVSQLTHRLAVSSMHCEQNSIAARSHCQSTGETAIGIPCSPIPCVRWNVMGFAAASRS